MKKTYAILPLLIICFLGGCTNKSHSVATTEEPIEAPEEVRLSDKELTALLPDSWDNETTQAPRTLMLTFEENGLLKVWKQTNQNNSVEITGDEEQRILTYKVINSQLQISYESTTENADDFAFEYHTDFSILDNNVLIVDSFSYDGSRFEKLLTLYRKMQPQVEPLIRGGHEGYPTSKMMIVKFANSTQKDKVILGHPIKRYNGMEGKFEYIENGGLMLNCQPSLEVVGFYALSFDMVHFEELEMDIQGTSPYIALTQDYYLVDWQWQQLLPLSALTNYAAEIGDYHHLYDHIMEHHLFTTYMDWSELSDLTKRWDNSLFIQPVQVAEIWCIRFQDIDRLYNDVKESDPYVCYNKTLYNEGLSVVNAYQYYLYGSCVPSRTYRTYIDYCNRLQDVYKERLIEIIENGQLETIDSHEYNN